jgi:gamma-glutamyltranspeptidase / glutathione hydrolase
VLHGVQPHQNGPGGEVPAILWSEREQRVRVLDGQGVAPAAATIDAFADLGLSEVPGTGLLSATVPGAVGGWLLLLERYGTWTLRDVLDYAIGYASQGFVPSQPLLDAIDTVSELFETDWPSSRDLWLPEAERAKRGGLMRNRELAQTYERLIADAERAADDRDGQLRAAREIWYTGPVAAAIDRFSSQTRWLDTSGEAHAGLLRGADLAAWQADFEQPVTVDYVGYTVAKPGQWGQGPVFCQQLRLLDQLSVARLPRGSADYAHMVIEAARPTRASARPKLRVLWMPRPPLACGFALSLAGFLSTSAG